MGSPAEPGASFFSRNRTMSILIVDNGPLPRIIRQGKWIKSYLRDAHADIVHAVRGRIPEDIDRYSGVILSGGTEPLLSETPWIMAELALITMFAVVSKAKTYHISITFFPLTT